MQLVMSHSMVVWRESRQLNDRRVCVLCLEHHKLNKRSDRVINRVIVGHRLVTHGTAALVTPSRVGRKSTHVDNTMVLHELVVVLLMLLLLLLLLLVMVMLHELVLMHRRGTKKYWEMSNKIG